MTVKENNKNLRKKEYIPPELINKSYYGGLLLEHAGYNVTNITGVSVYDIPPSFLERAICKRISLIHGGYHLPYEIFVKLYNPLIKSGEISPQNMSLERNIKYQFDHMSFWNRIGIVSPKVIDYHIFNMLVGDKEDVKLFGMNKIKVFALLTEYWPGTPYDHHIAAINHLIKSRETLSDKKPFVSDKDIEAGEEEIRHLRCELDKVVASILEATTTLNILGTYYTRNPRCLEDERLFTFSPGNIKRYYMRKLSHYMKQALILNGLFKKDFGIDDLDDPEKKQKIGKGIQSKFSEIGSYLTVLIKPFLVEEKDLIYIQGDENPNNYQPHLVTENNGVGYSVGIFDAGHVMKSIHMWSVVKLLSNHLVGFTYDDAMRHLDNNRRFIQNFKKNDDRFKSGEIIGKNVINLDITKPLDFRLLYIYELICNIGRKSCDFLFNREHFSEYLNRTIPYSNSDLQSRLEAKGIKLPTYLTPELHDPQIAIPKLIANLESVLERSLIANAEEVASLKKIREFLNKEKFFTKLTE